MLHTIELNIIIPRESYIFSYIFVEYSKRLVFYFENCIYNLFEELYCFQCI